MAIETFAGTQYDGYHKRDMPEEDEEITHVGPGTPCGEYFRRFWVPVARSDDLADLPLRARILGEDLVVFRDYEGRGGVLQLFCSHRGTSLEFGQIRQRGIQCCYHGWLYDVDGTILETPGEPADSPIKEKVRHGAYPALEHKGLVFAYMGPPERVPPFPQYDFWDYPEFPNLAYQWDVLPCNWLQIKENAMDPWHLYFLHTTMTGPQFTPDLQFPEHLFLETPRHGLCRRAAHGRRPRVGAHRGFHHSPGPPVPRRGVGQRAGDGFPAPDHESLGSASG